MNRLRSGELSSAELTEQCLERIERLDAELRVFVTVTADLARERARGADEALARGELLGPLHGLPVALKDNIDTAGIRTTAGAGFLADRVPREDAAVVERLDAAGAVLVGKVQLHELAYGGTTQNPHFGPCRNPWDPERIPGGSSGGSGAAVAAGMCAAALGTDTGGSVRIPAALNGVSGLRPTTGAISNRGLVWLTHSFDTIGPLARTVEDVAALYATLAGYDPEEPTSVPGSLGDPLAELETGIEGMRIGLPPASTSTTQTSPSWRPCARQARRSRASAPALWRWSCPARQRRSRRGRESSGPRRWRRTGIASPPSRSRSGRTSAAVCRPARSLGRRLRERCPDRPRVAPHARGRLRGGDAILSPVSGAVAPLAADCETIETTRKLTIRTYGWSLAGVPALAVPCGFSPEGMPIGMQLAAPAWREPTLFRIGAAYQRATDWHLREPPLVTAPVAG